MSSLAPQTTDVGHGGTGVTNVTTNALIRGAGSSPMVEITAAANSILKTDGSNVPSLSQTLPTQVQANITQTGTIGTGVWNATAIQSAYVDTTLSNKTLDHCTLYSTTNENIGTSTGGVQPSIFIVSNGSQQLIKRNISTFNDKLTPLEGGTGSRTAPTDGQVLIGSTSSSAYAPASITAGTGITITPGANTLTIASSVTPSASAILKTDASSVPSYSQTLPSVVQGNITNVGVVNTGNWQASTISAAFGGTGHTTYTDGQILIGKTSTGDLQQASLTAGSNITITPGAGTITIAAASAGGFLEYHVLSDVKANGTDGGNAAGATWNSRTLNTIVSYGGTSCTLSSNVFTLAAGTYFIKANAPFKSAGTAITGMLRIKVNGGAQVATGQSVMATGTTYEFSFLSTILVVGTSTSYVLEHYTSGTGVITVGLGQNANTGASETYAVVEIGRFV
jgi:hypothetical protein